MYERIELALGRIADAINKQTTVLKRMCEQVELVEQSCEPKELKQPVRTDAPAGSGFVCWDDDDEDVQDDAENMLNQAPCVHKGED